MNRAPMPRRSKPLARSGELGRGSGVDLTRSQPLASKSPKTRKRDAVLVDVVAAAAERDGGCVAAGILPGRCAGPLIGHHRIQKSVRPDLVLEPANVITVCAYHHTGSADSIHADEDRAERLDLLRRSWDWPERLDPIEPLAPAPRPS